MGERKKYIQRVQDAQILEIDNFLTREKFARRMTEQELGREGNRLAGWLADLTVEGLSFGIRIVLGRGFPFHPPEIRLVDASYYLRFPHIDRTGKMCLTSGPASFSPCRPKETIEYLLSEASKLLAECITGKNRKDFITEFQSYWPGHLAERASPFWSVLEPRHETRVVYYWDGQKFTLFAETPEKCHEWIKNLGGGAPPKGMVIHPTVFLWLNEPLYPEDYPSNNKAFRTLAKLCHSDVDEHLAKVAPRHSRNLPVIFGFESEDGPVFGGLVLREPKAHGPLGSKLRECKSDGFRQGRISTDLLLQRYFNPTPAIGANVVRGDSAWIHTRGGNGFGTSFAKKRVGIFGCGSLGADVAFLLAKSGVGNFYLTDCQMLTLDNVGRHLLGADSAHTSKTNALENFLKRQLPDVKVQTSGGLDIGTVLRESPKIFGNLDLIISTTGDWASDCALNVAAREWSDFPPVIFAWTEAYGLAGHAISVNSQGGCLACGMSEHGVFKGRVIQWQDTEKVLQRATGCGEFYQPYGVVDVAPTKTLIGEFALDYLSGRVQKSDWRTWVGDLSRMSQLGGSLQGIWKERLTADGDGKRFFNHTWVRNPYCPLCT